MNSRLVCDALPISIGKAESGREYFLRLYSDGPRSLVLELTDDEEMRLLSGYSLHRHKHQDTGGEVSRDGRLT